MILCIWVAITILTASLIILYTKLTYKLTQTRREASDHKEANATKIHRLSLEVHTANSRTKKAYQELKVIKRRLQCLQRQSS
jgi:hypothetical protein